MGLKAPGADGRQEPEEHEPEGLGSRAEGSGRKPLEGEGEGRNPLGGGVEEERKPLGGAEGGGRTGGRGPALLGPQRQAPLFPGFWEAGWKAGVPWHWPPRASKPHLHTAGVGWHLSTCLPAG